MVFTESKLGSATTAHKVDEEIVVRRLPTIPPRIPKVLIVLRATGAELHLGQHLRFLDLVVRGLIGPASTMFLISWGSGAYRPEGPAAA